MGVGWVWLKSVGWWVGGTVHGVCGGGVGMVEWLVG